MKRLLIMLMVFAWVFCQQAAAQKKKEISRPPGAIMWEVEDKENDVTYTIVPYDVVSPAGHKKCRELVKESDKGFIFFIVIIDNKKAAEPASFNAFGGDATFYYYPPKDPSKGKKEPEPEPKKEPLINLKNLFADPSNAPADKENYKKIKEQFKTNLSVPAGSYGWSLCCIRDAFIFDLKRNKVTWAFPGKMPEEMKIKKFNKSLLKKADVEVFE